MGYAGLQPEDPREIGPYRLLGQLGSGGMGQVFLGMSAGGRPIAVKVIRTELATDPDFRARFRREVAAAQKVSGLFTALVVDADLDCPMPWLATAYVAGPSLTEAVRGHGPLPVRSVLALTAGLTEGLDAIHAAGVVHRDLKPSNVLLAEDGPRVIDFGISEAAEASVVAGANVLIGSPGYMSPEQVLGSDIGPASDIFSLGSVLTFAATGTGPFGAGSHAALMYRLVNSRADLDERARRAALAGRQLPGQESRRPAHGAPAAGRGGGPPARARLARRVHHGQLHPGSARPAAANLTETSARPAGIVPPPRSGRPLRRGTAGPGRHRISRPLASACLTGGLVAGSAVAAFALIGANHAPAAGHHLQPQAGAGAVATSPAFASSDPASSPGTGSSSAPSAAARVSPNMFLEPDPVQGLQHVPAADADRVPVLGAAVRLRSPSRASPLEVLAARVVPAVFLAAGFVAARVVAPPSSPPPSSPPAVVSAAVVDPPASSPPRVVSAGVVCRRPSSPASDPGPRPRPRLARNAVPGRG